MAKGTHADSYLRSLIREMGKDAGAHGIGHAFVELSTELCSHPTLPLAAGTAAAAATGGSLLIPLAIALTVFGVAHWHERAEKAKTDHEAAEARENIKQIAEAVKSLLGARAGAEDALVEFANRRSPVWARLSGADQADFARKLNEEIRPALAALGAKIDDATAAIEQTLRGHWILAGDTNDRVRDIQATLARLVSGPRPATHIPNNLPDPSPHFASREEKLLDLHARLAKNETLALGQQVALWADGGVGKTMLAEHYGWVFLNDYPGGVFKINGEAIQLRTELASLAPLLSIATETRPPDEVAAAVEAALESTDSLVIIDNVPDNARWMDAEYRRFLPSGRCRRILTTREEYLTDAPMDYLDVFGPAAGRAILARHRPDADDPPNRSAAEAIVEWFGGLGSALLVVGVYMSLEQSLSWADYLTDLNRDGLAAARLTHDAVKNKIIYKERFDAAFDKTLGKLSAPEQRCLDYAALLPEDMVPGIWLKMLLEADPHIALEARPGFGTDKARPVVDHLTKLGLLRPSKAGKELVAVHRVLHARLKERAGADTKVGVPLMDSVEKFVYLLEERWVGSAIVSVPWSEVLSLHALSETLSIAGRTTARTAARTAIRRVIPSLPSPHEAIQAQAVAVAQSVGRQVA